MSSIFFARSKPDLRTLYESSWIDNIKEAWPNGEIIPFPEIDHEDLEIERKLGILYIERKYFFPLIDDCDIMVCAPAWNKVTREKRGKYTLGVRLEIEYGLELGKKVIGIINGVYGELKIMTLGDIKMEDINRKKFEKKFDEVRRTPWRLLTDEEKKEIMEKSAKKKEEVQHKENKKIADIIMGRQKTQDNAWT